jgi:hypothetical protein
MNNKPKFSNEAGASGVIRLAHMCTARRSVQHLPVIAESTL